MNITNFSNHYIIGSKVPSPFTLRLGNLTRSNPHLHITSGCLLIFSTFTFSSDPVFPPYDIRSGDRVAWLRRCAFSLLSTVTVTVIAITDDPNTLSRRRLRLILCSLILPHRLFFSLPLLPLLLFSFSLHSRTTG